MASDPALRWSRLQRALHWWTAALVLTAFPLGWIMVATPLHALLLKFLLYQLHKTLGIAVLGLVVIRAYARLTRARPNWDAGLPAWQQHAAAGMHAALYLLLLVVPLLGYLTAASAPARIPTLFLGVLPVPHLLAPDPALFALLRPLHRWGAILLVGLAAAHTAAAIHNHRAGRASLLRMWAGRTPAAP
jgi:cytochrome b561